MSAPSIDRATPTGATRPRLGAHAPGPLGGIVRSARKVAEALATPLVPADYLDLFDPLRTGADLRGRIVEVRPETADAATVVIRPGADWAGHVPGQYVRIGVDVDGVRHVARLLADPRPGRRRRAASRSPSRRCPTARSATTSSAAPRPGTLVHLEQAAGEFVLPARRRGKVLFVTAGSGITPVIGHAAQPLPGTDAAC